MAHPITPNASADLAASTTHAEDPQGRTLILCFDGTAGQYDNDNSNVVKLFSLLIKDPNEQLCYYQPGIGTWFKPGIVSPVLHWGAKLMDLAIAWYLDEHVLEGYRYVMQNYRAGDKICLFGFSRGAYTARALAGMLHKVGLLPRDNDAQMPFAYKLYAREDAEGLKLAEGFKKTYCQSVKIEFVGVWDTVASVGVIMGRTLPFTNSNSSIRVFRHAVALDEHRARFRANLYHRMTPTFASHSNLPKENAPPMKGSTSSGSNTSTSFSSSSNNTAESSQPKKRKTLIQRFLTTKAPEGGRVAFATPGTGCKSTSTVEGSDDVLEVWFAGGHADVGGGAVQNDAPHSLSNITLRWMVRQAASSGCGVRFNEEALTRENIALHSDADREVDELDRLDALEPIYDSLKISPIWWVLEIMPMTYVWQDKDGFWHRTFKWNLGKGRKIEEHRPHFHETVRLRSSAAELGYKPKAQWEPDADPGIILAALVHMSKVTELHKCLPETESIVTATYTHNAFSFKPLPHASYGTMLAIFWSASFIVASATSVLASPFGKPFNGSYDATPELSAELLTKRAVSSPYVFTAFTSKSESNLYVYTSSDGTNFSLLKGPAYTPPTGLIRDPSVILHTDGKYYISYTTNWSGQNFAIASSIDLQNWTLIATVSTRASNINPVNTWAPEFFKDPRTGQIHIIVSLSTGSYGPFLPYVFTATDSTLKSWSGPIVMSGISNSGLGYIDTFPVYYNGVYHIFTKAESNGKKTVEHATSQSLTGPYTFVQTGNFGGWGQAEGPCITVLPNGQYRLYADGFSSGKYIYTDSSDLYNWSAYKTIPSLSGTVRHGTVLKQS